MNPMKSHELETRHNKQMAPKDRGFASIGVLCCSEIMVILFISLFEMLPMFYFFNRLRSIRELHDARQLAPSSHVACGWGTSGGGGFEWGDQSAETKKKWRACWWIFLSFDYVQLLFSVHLIVYLAIDFLTFINFVPLDSHDSGIDHQGWPP